MEKKYNKDGKESKRTWYPRWCKYKELLPNLTIGVEDGLSYDEFTKKCLDELERLLSERTFTKGELKTASLLMSTANPHIVKEIVGKKKYNELWNKVSKLLKEEEE